MASIALKVLAEQLGFQLRGDPDTRVDHVDTLAEAGSGAITFLDNPKYRKYLSSTRASAVILSQEEADACRAACLITSNPYLGYARAAQLLHQPPAHTSGIHPSATVDPSATIGEGSWVGPSAVLGEGVVLGANCYIGPGCVVEPEVQLGEDCRLEARVTLCHQVKLGDRVIVHPGAVIGSDGFGLARDGERWVKIPQVGRVIIGDDVEIGANTTIDRGAIRDTIIEKGAKLDNQIQIAHNVRIGENTAIAGCVGISGSTSVGKNCTIGGGVGLAGHLTFGDNTHFTGQSLVTRSFEEPGAYSGNLPAMPNKEWRKAIARLRQLDDMARRLKAMEKQLAKQLDE